MDAESIATSIIYSTVKYTALDLGIVEHELGKPIIALLKNLLQLDIINTSTQKIEKRNLHQIDNIRKMLLAMAQDVRSVVIKLAERLVIMRKLKHLDKKLHHPLAQETMDIFAPLANRLGLHQIKWELEDLSYFLLNTDHYLKVAKKLDERRHDRETRVHRIVNELQILLKEASVDATIYGRAKHIFSIIRKMSQKNVKIEEIYDAIAIRILAPTIDDCYAALSLVHEKFIPIVEEFDDYISKPKPNGYQSIHTAVIDKDDKHFEIQIRTQKMHEEAELGVAAHWIYKEGKKQNTAYEQKISWLRQLLDWQKELSLHDNVPNALEKNVFEDRVYVFTPQNDIIDLPKGSTPLDFAYLIHTQVGHRCRGAKINGKIVSLNYQLKIGDRVEILTHKHGSPSRDWLQPKEGYLITSGARAKVMQWFRKQEFAKHVIEGRVFIEKELQRLQYHDPINWNQIATRLEFKSPEHMFAGLSRGNIRLGNVLEAIEATLKIKLQEQSDGLPSLENTYEHLTHAHAVTIHGLKNLLSKMALCCKPVPGDDIVGYITKTQGITIHRKGCKNIMHACEHFPERVIDTSWNVDIQQSFCVDLELLAYDKTGLLKEITTLLANDNVKLLALNASINPNNQQVKIHLAILVQSLDILQTTIDHLKQLPSINHVTRI